MKKLALFILLVAALILAGCSPAQTLAPAAVIDSLPAPLTQPGRWDDQTPLMDDQGAVTVEVTPLNLASPGGTLDFQISLKTHSVDLSMDLADLATLTADTGRIVTPRSWDAPLGGHHISGVISFPAETDGAAFLDGASAVTLTIVDVDAAERVFVWEK